MRPTGDPDYLYVAARQVLIDVLQALENHLQAIVLVGAQAVYLHTGDADLPIAPYTTDGDLALDPQSLLDEPLLADVMRNLGFEPHQQPGIWLGISKDPKKTKVTVDLLVPESLGGGGRRGARLGVHGDRAARKVKGLEGCLVDNELTGIGYLDGSQSPVVQMKVAGPAGLLVAKVHKLADRLETPDRLKPKDALDIYRLLRRISVQQFQAGFALLRASPTAMEVTLEAIDRFDELFCASSAVGLKLVVESLEIVEDPDFVAIACKALANELIDAIHN